MTKAERETKLRDQLQQAPVPDWLIEMQEHYIQTGHIRPKDLRRLLGDPNRRVEVGPRESLSSLFRDS